ncbi:hypothetical protein C8R42DRAFT_781203 [Lentinula raphanica]|nr:hypothetical protein C8R42DRAFT_781203 [Lentinula raphanica]
MDPMRLYPSLPDEILHHIIEYVAYTPEMSGAIDLGSRSIGNGKSLFKHASPELVESPRFFPANIEIRHDKDAEKLEKDLALCAKFTKNLAIGAFDAPLLFAPPHPHLLRDLCCVMDKDEVVIEHERLTTPWRPQGYQRLEVPGQMHAATLDWPTGRHRVQRQREH